MVSGASTISCARAPVSYIFFVLTILRWTVDDPNPRICKLKLNSLCNSFFESYLYRTAVLLRVNINMALGVTCKFQIDIKVSPSDKRLEIVVSVPEGGEKNFKELS